MCSQEDTIIVLSRQTDDDVLAVLALQLAHTALTAMDEAGLEPTLLNTMRLTTALRKALEQVAAERERAVRQERLDRRTAWVEGEGLLSADALARHLGLSRPEWETAHDLALIAPVEIPLALRATSEHFTCESWRFYRPRPPLTAAERAQIAHATLLTRAQAAQRLGVRPLVFDQLRAQHGVTPANPTCRRGDTQLNRYHTDDVDRLAAVAQQV